MPTRKPSRLLAISLLTLATACAHPPLLDAPGRESLIRSTAGAPPRVDLRDGGIESLWVPCPGHELPPAAAQGLSALLPGDFTAFEGHGRDRGRYRGTARYGANDLRGAVVEEDGTLWSRWHQIDPADAPAAVTRSLARDPEAEFLSLSFVQGGGPDRYRAELQPRHAPLTVLEITTDGRASTVRHRIPAELQFSVPRRR